MRDDQEISGALEEVLILLRKYGAGQAEYVAELLELLSVSRERFRESVLDNAVWGGAGSIVDVSLWSIGQDDEAMRDDRRLIAAILRLAEALRNAGLADERVLERAILLSKTNEALPSPRIEGPGEYKGKARFKVRLRNTQGFTEIVTVWAEGEAEAIDATKLWFEGQHDLDHVWVAEEAELIGPDSDPGDLGVAASNEAVNNRSLSPDGEILSTKFHVEPEHLRRSTRLMRQSDRPGWQRLRERLREKGIDPSDAAVADISVHEPDPHNPVWLIARGLGRTIVSYSPRFDSVQEIDARWFWGRNDAVQAAEAILKEEQSLGSTDR